MALLRKMDIYRMASNLKFAGFNRSGEGCKQTIQNDDAENPILGRMLRAFGRKAGDSRDKSSEMLQGHVSTAAFLALPAR
jgi:hypothetical protein